MLLSLSLSVGWMTPLTMTQVLVQVPSGPISDTTTYWSCHSLVCLRVLLFISKILRNGVITNLQPADLFTLTSFPTLCFFFWKRSLILFYFNLYGIFPFEMLNTCWTKYNHVHEEQHITFFSVPQCFIFYFFFVLSFNGCCLTLQMESYIKKRMCC